MSRHPLQDPAIPPASFPVKPGLIHLFPLLAAVFLLSAPPITSHPHMFIDSRVEIVLDQSGLKGFQVEWLFDQFFTAQIILDYDLDQSKSFDSSEVRAIEAGAFSNLINYNYFTTLEAAGKRSAISRVENFDAFLRDERLGYHFFVPFKVSLSDKKGSRIDIRLSIFDHTFFCDIAATKEHPVLGNSTESIAVSWNIERNKDDPIVYAPQTGLARREGINYTGTVFPEEIHFTLVRK